MTGGRWPWPITVTCRSTHPTVVRPVLWGRTLPFDAMSSHSSVDLRLVSSGKDFDRFDGGSRTPDAALAGEPKGLYVPELVVFSDLAADRLLKKYHRRWYFGHGRFYALARLEEFEHSNVGWLFGVAAHVYRRAIGNAVQWLASLIRGNFRRAFRHEKDLWFFFGFWSVHYKEFLDHGPCTHIGELSRFGWVLTRRLFPDRRLGESLQRRAREHGYVCLESPRVGLGGRSLLQPGEFPR